jgi:hypothetical protein
VRSKALNTFRVLICRAEMWHSEPVQSTERPTTAGRKAQVSNTEGYHIVGKPPGTQTRLHRHSKGLANYEKETPSQSTATAARVHSSPPIQVPMKAAGSPTHQTGSNKLRRPGPHDASTPAQVLHVSTSNNTPTQTSSQSQLRNRGESRGHIETGNYGRTGYETYPEPAIYPQPATKTTKSSWGGNLLKGMAKSVVKNAASQVVSNTNMMVDSSIDSAFTTRRSQ